MATYKCDIKKQYGKFSATVWRATDKSADAPVAKDVDTVQLAVSKVIDGIGKLGYAEGDEVIFRDTAYASLGELKGVMLRAPY